MPKVIIFMGMPGSGKSTLARKYAYNTKKIFFDADDIHKPFGEKKSKGIYKDHSNYYNKIIQVVDVLLEEGGDVVIAEPLKKQSQRDFFTDKYGDCCYFIQVKPPNEEERIEAIIRRYSIEYPNFPREEIISFLNSKPGMEPINEKNHIEIINNYDNNDDFIQKINSFIQV